MMFSSCCIRTSGKWILTGEHAVLRGKKAIAFPLPSRQFILEYHNNEQQLTAHCTGEGAEDLYQAFWQGFDKGLALLSLSRKNMRGHFHARNHIPIGSGMGASAALCVSLARWFIEQRLLPATELTAFATELEHLYHGQSSGLDIAGVQAQKGIVFQKGDSRELPLQWQPYWGISYCGETGTTAHCIGKVQQLRDMNPKLADRLDSQMQESCELALEAFQLSAASGITKLSRALTLGQDCFRQWGLISPALEKHILELTDRGALSSKPTGSGAGGYVVSLWATPPPEDLWHDQQLPKSSQGNP
ncbi:MAG: mevalonate kinase [Legionellaceae bacterium]|nr:mevalonate kinase [Legionellaceae bacterium]